MLRTTKDCSFHNQPASAHTPLPTMKTNIYAGKTLNAASDAPKMIRAVPSQASH